MSTNSPDGQPFGTPPTGATEPPPVFTAPPSINPAVFNVAKARKPGRVTLTSILLAAAAVIAVAGVAFAVGRVTAPPSTAGTGFGRAFQNGANGGTGNGFPGAGQRDGGFFGPAAGGLELRGTVTAVSGDTITIQLTNGRSVTVQTSSSTTYHTQVSGSASDVATGKSVAVQVQGGTALRGLFGQNGGTGGSVTVPAADVTVTGS